MGKKKVNEKESKVTKQERAGIDQCLGSDFCSDCITHCIAGRERKKDLVRYHHCENYKNGYEGVEALEDFMEIGKETKHTPGPLVASLRTVMAVREGGNRSVAKCLTRGMDELCEIDSFDEAQANAILYAAAPGMLKALEEARQEIHSDCIEEEGCSILCVDLTYTIATAKGL